jgi:hypothetical protein
MLRSMGLGFPGGCSVTTVLTLGVTFQWGGKIFLVHREVHHILSNIGGISRHGSCVCVSHQSLACKEAVPSWRRWGSRRMSVGWLKSARATGVLPRTVKR